MGKHTKNMSRYTYVSKNKKRKCFTYENCD